MSKLICGLSDFVVLEDGVFSICFINSILHLGNCLIFLIGGSILFKNLLNQTGNKIFSNLQISSNNSRKEKLKLITCLILSFIWILDLITYLGLYAIFSIDMFFIPLLNFICWLYCFRIMKEQYSCLKKNDSNRIKLWTTLHFILLGLTLQSEFHFNEDPFLILLSILLTLFSFFICILTLFFDSTEETYSELEEDFLAKYETKKNGEIGKTFISHYLYSFISPLLKLGSKRPLEQTDLFYLPPSLSCELNSSKFIQAWDQQLKRPKPNIFLALFHAFGKRILVIGILEFIHDIAIFTGPVIINQIILYVESDSNSNSLGLILIFSLFMVNIIQALTSNQFYWLGTKCSIQVRAALTNTIYSKAFHLTNQSRQETTIGEIINLESVDTKIIEEMIPYIHSYWSDVFQIGLGIYLMYQQLGLVCFASIGVFILLGPPISWVTSAQVKFQEQMMEHKDGRSKLMNEILNGIRIIKCFSWENSFMNKINSIRNQELAVIKKTIIYRALTTFLWLSTPVLVSTSTFTLYVLLGNELTVAKTFTCLAIVHLMEYPLYSVPMMISYLIQMKVSSLRIQEFLLQPELKRETSPDNNDKIKDAIQIQNGTFKWGDSPILSNINLSVPHGSLVAVVGSVGAGKSSLLSAILGEMEKLEGNIYVNGSIAYVSQSAWIQNNTVQNNILFGEPFNESFYASVIKNCEIEKDLSILSHGDKTEIGERGINLSGGQKQRLSLARAVYQNKDIYLLDDPLSAVDSHVGKNLFDYCIKGILKKTTRILVTHQLQFVPFVDTIVVIKDGKISEIGSFQQLMEAKSEFYELYSNHIDEGEKEATSNGSVKPTRSLKKERKLSRTNENLRINPPIFQPEKLKQEEIKDKLIVEEDRETGSVSFKVWKSYIIAIGGISVAGLILFISLLHSGSVLSIDFWLAYWSSNPNEHSIYFYLAIYVFLNLISSILIIIYSVIFSLGGLNSSKIFHSKMLTSILHAPMKFFDTNPVGRILNRFTKDQYSIDMELSDGLEYWVSVLFQLLEIIFIIVFVIPLLILFLVPLAYIYQKLYQFYIRSYQELKRLDSISKSPIDNHFSETLHGLSTIRAFKKQEQFLHENYHKIDENSRAFHCYQTASAWFSLRLQFIGAFLVCASTIFIFLGKNTLAVGLVGLSLSYSLQLTSSLEEVVRHYVGIQSDMVAVERISGFINVEQEAPSIIESSRPPKNWPDKGEIVLENVNLRYREGMDLVLKGISCSIKSKEKIGIVGRTGAGKSSLFLALFRLVELAEGKVIIDGIDISTIGLADLRPKISIIPQDPTLFAGTVRTNLDPFSEYSNEDIWRALETAHLKKKIKELPDQLESNVAEYGDNFSIGQRQLLCLARAILRNARILIMDEATASVDMETDSLIQQTIRNEFMNSTVLTIAHRINTILDYDRVMVLDQGQMMEFDSPSKLLENPSSLFSSLTKNSSVFAATF